MSPAQVAKSTYYIARDKSSDVNGLLMSCPLLGGDWHSGIGGWNKCGIFPHARGQRWSKGHDLCENRCRTTDPDNQALAMASFGKISNSLIQGTNENTLALASINFDFSLVSLAAPTEYTAVGTALAHSRRENAEHGSLHRTARKLGALFEGVVPQVPHLVSAYGERASEIMKHPGLNPSGNFDHHGPFAAFVGADASSIWAAATSGGPSIAIHLLGCLLARTFSDPTKSISALVELVNERQKMVMSDRDTFSATAAQNAAVRAAQQSIERDELQQWDASARAWLQTADSAMKKEYIQLKLILKNVSLPVTSGGSLYDKVIRAWRQAMHGLECLLKGESQSVTDGSILLAISAWHLYPNLLVLGQKSTNVDFGDRGIQSSGLLTVGITNAQGSEGAKEGIYWSMALSHYRYYGRALNAVGEIGERLTIDQLHLVALGSLLGSWKVPRDEVRPAAKWLVTLEGCLNRTQKSLGCPPWLAILAKAAKDVLDIDSPSWNDAFRLFEFGQRRGTNLLHPRSQPCLPWFGLRFSHIVDALTAETLRECAVQYLRSIAKAGKLRYDEALITIITNTPDDKKMSFHQYFTANTPDDTHVEMPVADINEIPDLENDHGPIARADKGKSKRIDNGVGDSRESPANSGLSSHQEWSGIFSGEDFDSLFKGDQYRKYSMASFLANLPQQEIDMNISTLTSRSPPELSTNASRITGPGYRKSLPTPLRYTDLKASHTIPPGLLFDSDAVLPEGLTWFPSRQVLFAKFMGDPNGTIRLWLARGRAVDECDDFTTRVRSLQSGESADLLDMKTATRLLDEGGELEPLHVWQYLEGVHPYEPDSAIKEVLGLMRTEREKFGFTVKSLRSLEMVTDIYNGLDGAKISASIVERGLYQAKWARTGRYSPVTRSMVFSCIAMMETGKINLDAQHLEQVIALSSGNSLFVSTRLLTDPYVEVAESSVTRIVGNIGQPGVNLLIPPAASPLIRSLSTSYLAVTYAPFNGRREDNFKGTTLHMSFTSHKFPLDYGVTGIPDHQVFFVESVISIHDCGKWVADLDTLEAFRISNEHRMRIPRRRQNKTCTHPKEVLDSLLDGITSIDTWEEVLDTSSGVNIVRAHKNWPARLAASVMLSTTRTIVKDSEEMDSEELGAPESEEALKHERHTILENGDDVCWVCLHRRLSKTGSTSTERPFYIIA